MAGVHGKLLRARSKFQDKHMTHVFVKQTKETEFYASLYVLIIKDNIVKALYQT